MSNNHPFAYYDPTHDKLLWAEGPQYVHAQRTEGMSLKPLYLHPPTKTVPMTEKEIMAIIRADDEFDEMMWDKAAIRFVRAIEKHHGIGEDDD